MQELAAEFAQAFPIDTVLALHGDLGAGKTTFVQGFARGLGVDDAITSPTFTLFNVHRGERARLIHFDAYRLESDAQLESLMLEDFLVSPWIVALEWPERIAAWLPASAWHLDLQITGEQHEVRLR